MNFYFLASILMLLVYARINIVKFGSLVNPVFFVIAQEFGLRVLLGYVAYYYMFPVDPSLAVYLDEALFLSFWFALFYIFGSLTKIRLLDSLILKISSCSVRSFSINSKKLGKYFSVLILGLGLISFVLLAYFGGGQALWLTEPRAAYLTFRTNFGFLWSLFASSIPLSLLLYIHSNKVKAGFKLAFITVLYLFVAYFTGSKQTMMGMLLALFFYITYFVRLISFKSSLFMFLGFLLLFLSTTILQGSFDSILDAFQYFDYINSTAMYLESQGSMSDIRGFGYISTLWGYLPRILFPEKPYEYGVVLINSVLFPGAAEEGYTPGYYVWVLAHFDLGFVGVIAAGFFQGVVNSSFFRTFLADRSNVFLFIINCHIGFQIFNMPGAFEFGFIGLIMLTSLMRQIAKHRSTGGAALVPAN